MMLVVESMLLFGAFAVGGYIAVVIASALICALMDLVAGRRNK